MSDKDFDKILGDHLREAQQFKGENEDWTRLAGRLEGVQSGDTAAIAAESNGFRRWILPLVALLLLLMTGLLFGKLNQLDKTNAALIEQMHALKTASETPFKTRVDTVFITKIDTVFINNQPLEKTNKTTYLSSKTKDFKELNKAHFELNTVHNLVKNNAELMTTNAYSRSNNLDLINANKNVNAYSPANENQLTSNNENQLKNKIIELVGKLQVIENQQLALNDTLVKLKEKIGKTPLDNGLNAIDLTNKLTHIIAHQNDSFTVIIGQKDILIAQLNSQLDSVLMDKKILNTVQLDAKSTKEGPLSINDKNTIKINKKPLTSRLFVGVNGGIINYKTTWKTPQNVNVFRNEKSYQIGLKLEYALTDRLRLTAGADYCPFEFQIFWQDSRYNLPTPTHYYPPIDKIKSSKALQQLTEAAIGVKYLFTGGQNRWRPYVGAAYTTMKILPFETEYEVQNIASGAVRTLKEASAGVNVANLLLLNGGLEYRFSRRFVAHGEAFYNLDLNRPQKMYDLFGIRGAFLVNF